MDWLDRMTRAFILTFGITQPSPQGRRAASLLIGGLLLLVVLVVLAGVAFGIRQLL
jgi:hypothetical protein